VALSTIQTQSKRKRTDIISVIHSKGDAFALEIIHVQRDRSAAALGRKHELELPWARRQEVRRTVLIAERVAADDDGLDPSWDGSRDALKDDWLAEDGAAEDVADLGTREKATSGRGRIRGERRKPVLWPPRCAYGAIGRAPHLLQLEFFHALLVRRDGRALDANIVLENRLGRLDRYLIVSLGTRAGKIRRESRSVRV